MAAQDWVNKDFYKVLGVKKDASQADIKKAYRKLAQELHPDRNPDSTKAEERFKAVSEAYAVLGNADKRTEYDEVRASYRGGGFHFPGGGGGSGQTPGNVNLGDIFGNSNLGDLFGGLFNRGGGTTTGPTTGRRMARRGADVETEVTIAFDDALDGVTVPLRLTGEGPCQTCHGTGAKAGTTPRVCDRCEGTGQVVRNQGGFAIPEVCPQCHGRGLTVDDPCPTCHGSGRAASSRVVHARIPAGVKDGQRVRLAGKGAPGENGGPSGDLHVRVNVGTHPVFGRAGENLTVTVPVTFSEATLGADITVPAPGGGSVKLKIPAGTANGRTFRVRGRGVRRRDGTQGDLLVSVEVAVPQNLSGKAADALRSYAEATSDHDPRADLMALAAQTGRRRGGDSKERS
jgi:molecular chaperone DnaJ